VSQIDFSDLDECLNILKRSFMVTHDFKAALCGISDLGLVSRVEFATPGDPDDREPDVGDKIIIGLANDLRLRFWDYGLVFRCCVCGPDDPSLNIYGGPGFSSNEWSLFSALRGGSLQTMYSSFLEKDQAFDIDDPKLVDNFANFLVEMLPE